MAAVCAGVPPGAIAAIAISWTATVSASCFTRVPSSLISADIGAEAGRDLSASSRLSSAAIRRPDSATCRARSPVPRDRSAIWPPKSERSRNRVVTAL